MSEPRKEVFTEDRASDKGSPVIQSSKKKRIRRLLSSSEEDDDEVKEKGSPVIQSSKKKRIRRLLSSSEEDDDEVKEIKNFAKRLKSKSELEPSQSIKSFNRSLHREVSVRVPILKIPKRAVSAKVGSENKIIEWATLSKSDYMKVTRAWAGLNPDGSQGTPLFQALEPDEPEDSEEEDGLSDVSSGEIPVTNEAEEDVVEIEIEHKDAEVLDEKKKTWSRFTKEELSVLRSSYSVNRYPKRKDIMKLTKAVNQPYERVERWFRRERKKRQETKTRQQKVNKGQGDTSNQPGNDIASQSESDVSYHSCLSSSSSSDSSSSSLDSDFDPDSY